MEIERYKSTDPLELKFGASRAVSLGPLVYFSVIRPRSNAGFVEELSVVEQLHSIFGQISESFKLMTQEFRIIRLKIYILSRQDIDVIASTVREKFGGDSPAMTFLLVHEFLVSGTRVELEIDAAI